MIDLFKNLDLKEVLKDAKPASLITVVAVAAIWGICEVCK
jgi:hypothetical protein